MRLVTCCRQDPGEELPAAEPSTCRWMRWEQLRSARTMSVRLHALCLPEKLVRLSTTLSQKQPTPNKPPHNMTHLSCPSDALSVAGWSDMEANRLQGGLAQISVVLPNAISLSNADLVMKYGQLQHEREKLSFRLEQLK